jgi:nitronate monooxygenase
MDQDRLQPRALTPIIQGGMGVAISDWRLARSVAEEGYTGIVSGTGVALVFIARLQRGDPGGHVRRSLARFPDPSITEMVLERYFVEGGIGEGERHRRPLMWSLKPKHELVALTVVANFVEVDLARSNVDGPVPGPVGINLLEKIQLPHMASLYGAMLAGVDVVIMGAGMPTQIPGILDRLATHQPVRYRLDVVGPAREDGADDELLFDPSISFPELVAHGPLKRPAFLPIISSNILATAMVKRASGPVQGFVVEAPTAGGHNAPPRGKMQLDERGEPIYGKRDVVDLERLQDIGLPFWMAGGYGRKGGLAAARALGAAGIQVGTAFAFCTQSGMATDVRRQVLHQALDGAVRVRTAPAVSPTGYPFKVVEADGSLSDMGVYAKRQRVCDLGFLRTLYRTPKGSVGFRCPAEPAKAFLAKGGTEEEMEGRVCLCNALEATAGFAQLRAEGEREPPVVTAGDALADLSELVPADTEDGEYSAADVIAWLLEDVQE